MRPDVEQRFVTEAKTLQVLRERAKAEVVRWSFSTDELWSYEDLRKPGSDSSILPGPDGAFHACGYDHADRPVVLQHFDWKEIIADSGSQKPALQRIPAKETWAEEFISYQGDTLDVVRFVRGELKAVYRLTFVDRLLIEKESFEDGFYRHTRFKYERRRRVLQQSLSDSGQAFFEIAFGPHGEQSFFRVRRDGTRAQLYQPLPKGITVKSVKETIRNRLLDLVPKVVALASIREPVYCVALAYDGEGNDVLPPAITIGLESERQRWQAEHGKDAWQWIWNPAEFQHYEKPHTQLEDETLEIASDQLNSKLAERDSLAPAIKLLVETATELNNASWPAEVQRTGDFVVYAVDLELGNLRRNLKSSLQPERLAELKANKFL